MSTHRILDASANRAHEALRTLEDTARLTLGSADLSARLKSLRHDLATALANIPSFTSHRLTHRDTATDVGTTVTTPQESRRASTRDVAAAACARLTQSLRSLEEHAKLLTPSATFEPLRYRAYDLERDLLLALGACADAPHWRLCVLVTESLCATDWRAVVEQSLAGGADAIQLREKSLDDAELLRRATWLTQTCASAGAYAIINDRADIAAAAGAHALHLGQSDLPIASARKVLGQSTWIGLSCTTLDQALAAHQAGADTLGVGPIFQTNTKPNPGGRTDGSLAGIPLLTQILDSPAALRPILAIGGIDATNAHQLPPQVGIAVSSAVCASPDPRAACAALLAALDQRVP